MTQVDSPRAPSPPAVLPVASCGRTVGGVQTRHSAATAAASADPHLDLWTRGQPQLCLAGGLLAPGSGCSLRMRAVLRAAFGAARGRDTEVWDGTECTCPQPLYSGTWETGRLVLLSPAPHAGAPLLSLLLTGTGDHGWCPQRTALSRHFYFCPVLSHSPLQKATRSTWRGRLSPVVGMPLLLC